MAVSRRGCHTAALSTAILTLSLDRVSDPTRMRLLIDGLALRAERPHTLWLLDQSFQGELRQLPGWAFSIALALHQINSSQLPSHPSAAAATAAASSSPGARPEWEDGGAEAIRTALLTFPSMLLAALQACRGGSPPALALCEQWKRVLSPLLAVPELHFGSATLQHMQALYWERAADAWKHEALEWLLSAASTILVDLQSEIGLPAASSRELEASSRPPHPSTVARLKELSGRARSWFPSHSPNSLRGSEFARLRAFGGDVTHEQPVEQPTPVPAEDEAPLGGEWGQAGEEASDEEGGGRTDALGALEEECDALAQTVQEMETMVARGVASRLRAMIEGRLKSLDERLTQAFDFWPFSRSQSSSSFFIALIHCLHPHPTPPQRITALVNPSPHMCAIDSLDVAEEERSAKRDLTLRMDALCARLADSIARFS
ncbi:MAG: hypothetical protein SGPRY_010154, partial [Prymnesium sp.]